MSCNNPATINAVPFAKAYLVLEEARANLLRAKGEYQQARAEFDAALYDLKGIPVPPRPDPVKKAARASNGFSPVEFNS